MKRFSILLMTVIMLFATITMVSAAGESKTECTTANTSYGRGDTVEVTVVLSNCDKMKSMSITPVYDADVFELVSGEWLVTGALIADFDMAGGNAAIVYTSETDINGEVFTFTLKVKDDAAFGNTVIKAKPVVKNGSVTVECSAVETAISVACDHNVSGSWSNDADQHWKECTVSGCGEKSEVAAHKYDNDCDTDCNVCGRTRTISHSYETAWSSDGTNHWHECSVCGDKKDLEAHNGGSATCQDKAVCVDCATAYGELSGHTYVEKAEDEYMKSEATCIDKAVYYTSCDVCGAQGTETFEYGVEDADNHIGETEVRDASDATCTVDGYTGDTYCLDCGVLLLTGERIFAGHDLTKVDAKDATHEEDGNIEYFVCEKCEKLYVDETATEEIALADTVIAKGEHEYSSEYMKDAENHWKECACGSKAEEAAHEYGEWTVTKEATETEEGSQERTCTSCGYVEAEVIEALGAADEETPTTGDTGVILCVIILIISMAAFGVVVMRKNYARA